MPAAFGEAVRHDLEGEAPGEAVTQNVSHEQEEDEHQEGAALWVAVQMVRVGSTPTGATRKFQCFLDRKYRIYWKSRIYWKYRICIGSVGCRGLSGNNIVYVL